MPIDLIKEEMDFVASLLATATTGLLNQNSLHACMMAQSIMGKFHLASQPVGAIVEGATAP